MFQLINDLSRTIFNPGTLEGALLFGFIFLILALLLARMLQVGANALLKRDIHRVLDQTTVRFLLQFGRALIFLIAFVLYAHLVPALRALGTALLAGVSVASIIFGLAAQNTLGNLVAGLSLILYRPFRLDDTILVNTPWGIESGQVTNVTLGYTTLHTADNRHVVIPNNVMTSQITVNMNTEKPQKQAVVPVRISYQSDVQQAREIMLGLATNHPLTQEVIGCPVTQFGDLGVTLTLRLWCASAGDAQTVTFDLLEQIKTAFDQANLVMAELNR